MNHSEFMPLYFIFGAIFIAVFCLTEKIYLDYKLDMKKLELGIYKDCDAEK